VEQKAYLRIPKDRVGVLIGSNGKTKYSLENIFKVNLHIIGDTGDVEITPRKNMDDISILFTVQKVVKAIGRGFSPPRALTLINEDNELIIIDLEDYVGNSKKAQNRVKSRVIGKGGKSREILEQLTDCLISVYGSTISIIGSYDMVLVAKESIEMLLNGSFHKTVWNHLYAFRSKLKKERSEIWYE
jgi:ribosomal RNA assembly protein